MKTQTLKCAAGHTWTRDAQRGKPPRYCPEHKPAKPASSGNGTQTLKCAAGHDWERPSQRGKPPRYCPEHKPAKPAPASRPTAGIEAAQAAKAEADAQRAEEIAEEWRVYKEWSGREAALTAQILQREADGEDATDLRTQRIAMYNPSPPIPRGPDPERSV